MGKKKAVKESAAAEMGKRLKIPNNVYEAELFRMQT